jgi:hypothetical protein
MAIHEAIEQARRKSKDKFGSTAIDLANFYLDDGMVAGSAAAVLHWLTFVEEAFGQVGLELCRSKCIVVPAAGGDTHSHMFQGMQWNKGGDFKLLGAAFGSIQFCTDHLRKRSTKAKQIMDELGVWRMLRPHSCS